MALLLSIWIVTSGGPKLAIRHDKIDPFHTSQILDREYDNDFFFYIYILSILVKKKNCATLQELKPVIEPKPSPSDSYCLILGQISGSRPIWSMLFCSQHELEHSIPAPGPTSRCSDHTSSALLPYTSALPSSAPVALCHPQHCPHSCTKEKETNPRTRIRQHCIISSVFCFPSSIKPPLLSLGSCYVIVLCICYSPYPTPLLLERSIEVGRMVRFIII